MASVSGFPMCIKYLIFILSLVNLCIGIYVLFIETWIAVEHSQYFYADDIAIMVSVVCWFGIGICGICGSLKENIKCLYAYAGSIIILFTIRFILRATLSNPDIASAMTTQMIQFMFAILPFEISDLVNDLVFTMESIISVIMAYVLICYIKKQHSRPNRANILL